MIHIPVFFRALNILTEIIDAGMEILKPIVWYETTGDRVVIFCNLNTIVC